MSHTNTTHNHFSDLLILGLHQASEYGSKLIIEDDGKLANNCYSLQSVIVDNNGGIFEWVLCCD